MGNDGSKSLGLYPIICKGKNHPKVSVFALSLLSPSLVMPTFDYSQDLQYAGGTSSTALLTLTFSGNSPATVSADIHVVTNDQSNPTKGCKVTYVIKYNGSAVVTPDSTTAAGSQFLDSTLAATASGAVWTFSITPGTGQPAGNSCTAVRFLYTDDATFPTVS